MSKNRTYVTLAGTRYRSPTTTSPTRGNTRTLAFAQDSLSQSLRQDERTGKGKNAGNDSTPRPGGTIATETPIRRIRNARTLYKGHTKNFPRLMLPPYSASRTSLESLFSLANRLSRRVGASQPRNQSVPKTSGNPCKIPSANFPDGAFPEVW